MKTTLKLPLILLLFCLFSCTDAEKDIQDATFGQIIFSYDTEITERIELTNAKRITEEGKPWITVYSMDQDKEAVIDGWLESGYYNLHPGAYGVYLKIITQKGPYADKVEAQNSTLHEFFVQSGQSSNVEVTIHRTYISILLRLINMDGATVWIGEKGFEPADNYLYDPEEGNGLAQFFPDEEGNFDIVIEYAGETKRFGAKSVPGSLIEVIITNNRGAGSPGQVAFDWKYEWTQENTRSPIQFSW